MAEVFGIVAGTLNIAQILAQILDATRQIHHFCSSAKNAPKTIRDTVAELNLLSQIVQNLERYPQFFESNTGSTSLQYCCEAARELQQVVSKLQDGLEHKKKSVRYLATIKAAWRNDDIQIIHQRIERAKTMINLVISGHILMVQQNPATKAHKSTDFSTNGGDSIAEITSIPSQHTERYVMVSSRWLSSFLGIYSQYSRIVRKTRVRDAGKVALEDKRFTNWVVLPSAWLRIWGVSLSYTRTCFNSEYLLRPIRVVTDDSPIFQACIEGNIERVSLLLNNSLATLQDTSKWGWTLLHIAAMHAQPELCSWLIQKGCSRKTLDVRNGWTPLHAIAALSGRTMASNLIKKRKELSILQLPRSRLSSSRIQDTIRVLVEHGSYDPLDQSTTGWSALHEYSGPLQPFRYMIEQQQDFCIDFNHFTIEEHNDLAWSLADQYGESSAELLLVALNNGLKPNMIDPFKPAWNRYRSSTLLHIEAQRLDRYVHAGYSLDSSLKVIRKYIKTGSNLHARDSFGSTPLDDILSYKGFDDSPQKMVVILEWMQLLHGLKVDLKEYFREEERIHDSGSVIHVKYQRPTVDRKFGTAFESNTGKVTISVTDVMKIQQGECHLPGTWVDERGGFERDTLGRCICKDVNPCLNCNVSFKLLGAVDRSAMEEGV